ncbi:MAG: hypothetical protein Q4A21_03230 [bacterium]|nr:hypothetical protein [bacterium]
MKLSSRIKLKTLVAFLRGRRESVIIDILSSDTLTDKFIFWAVRIFLKKNSKFEKQWKKDFTDYYTTIFLFRNFEDLRKFDISQKMTFAENPVEKPTLLGKALGYPDFAIEDFVELNGSITPGDRIGIKCFEWGYDGFVCRAENFDKMKSWLIEQKIPLKKS